MIFYILAGAVLISAILSVTLKNLFHCALALICALLSLAAMYYHLGAHLLAIMHLMIYVGATVILIIFAVMLTSRISDKMQSVSAIEIISSFAAIILFFTFTFIALSKTIFLKNPIQKNDSIFGVGTIMLTKYSLPFALISLIMLAVLIGAITIARRDK